jgi:hypothetical protein
MSVQLGTRLYTFSEIESSIDKCIADLETAAALSVMLMPSQAAQVNTTLAHQLSALRSLLDELRWRGTDK